MPVLSPSNTWSPCLPTCLCLSLYDHNRILINRKFFVTWVPPRLVNTTDLIIKSPGELGNLLFSVLQGQGHYATEMGPNLPCYHDIVRIAHPITAKLDRYIPLLVLSTCFGGILSETFLAFFFVKFEICFSPVEHSICHILKWLVQLMWNKKVNWMLHWLGCLWPWPLTLNFQGRIVSREWEARLSWN